VKLQLIFLQIGFDLARMAFNRIFTILHYDN
jgi:hypothetical protein